MDDGLCPVGLGRFKIGDKRGRAYGHDIITDKGGVTRYCDDLTLFGWENLRPCAKCGLNPRDFGGHDPCIAGLPGVRNACCGHGVDEAYIEFDDGRAIYGAFVVGRRRPTREG